MFDVITKSVIPYTLQVGSIYMEVLSAEPEKQKIKLTFRTPCNNYIGHHAQYVDVKIEAPNQHEIYFLAT